MAKYPALDLRFEPGPGAGAFQDLLYAELDPFEPTAIQEHDTGDGPSTSSGHGWRVFFRTAAHRNKARTALLSEFRNALLDCTRVDVDDEDWARRSQQGLKAIRIGKIVVAPPWGAPVPGSGDRGPGSDITIVIEPSMGFGTGHHATTRLCLELLQEIDVAGKSVIDVGTGSGVLAIAAAKLGASHVVALDNDPDALENARGNVKRNGVGDLIHLREADIASLEIAPAQIVLANLTAALLQRAAASLRRVTDDTLIVSGFGPDEFDAVRAALGGKTASQRQDGEWMAAAIKKPRES